MPGEPYSKELKEKARHLFLRGYANVQIARELGISSKATITNWAKDGKWEEQRDRYLSEVAEQTAEEFKASAEQFNKSKVSFLLKMYTDMVDNYQNGKLDFERLKCLKISTEIIENITAGLGKVMNLQSSGAAKEAKEFVEATTLSDDEISEIYG